MKDDGPYFAVVTPATCYHRSPDCPGIDQDIRDGFIARPVKYPTDEAAFNAGHTRLCIRCRGDVVVEYEEDLYMRLTVQQMDTLKVIKNIYAKTNSPLTLSQIADAKNRKISSCFTQVNRLVDKGLVTKKFGSRRKLKASNGSIVPTSLADKVLAKLK